MPKRSITLAGHRTSLALEPEFWDVLDAMAGEAGLSVAKFVADIDARRENPNLTSALRVEVLRWLQHKRVSSAV